MPQASKMELIEMIGPHMEDLMAEWDTKLDELFLSGKPLNAGSSTKDEKDEKTGGSSKDSSDDDDDDDSDDDDDDEEDTKTPEQLAIDKAHAKLRVAEKAERAATKRADAAERKNMSASDAEKARADAAEARIAEYEEKEAKAETEKDVVRVAKKLKFKNPEAAARRFMPTVGATDAEIRTALQEALEDFPDLAGDGSTPPPVNEGGKGGGTDMSAMIRKSAGRSG